MEAPRRLAGRFEVVPPPVINSFTASDGDATNLVITNGEPTTLSWTTTDATSVSITNTSISGSNRLWMTSSVSVSPTSTTDYELTAENDDGQQATATVTIEVVEPPMIVCLQWARQRVTAGRRRSRSELENQKRRLSDPQSTKVSGTRDHRDGGGQRRVIGCHDQRQHHLHADGRERRRRRRTPRRTVLTAVEASGDRYPSTAADETALVIGYGQPRPRWSWDDHETPPM